MYRDSAVFDISPKPGPPPQARVFSAVSTAIDGKMQEEGMPGLNIWHCILRQ